MMNYEIAFWVLLIIFILLFIAMIVVSIVNSFTVPEGNDGLFRLMAVPVDHLDAKSMDVVVQVVYKRKARAAKMATYDDITRTIRAAMDSPSFLADHKWDQVAKDLGAQMWHSYDILGISLELFVAGSGTADDVQAATFTRGYAPRLLRLDALA